MNERLRVGVVGLGTAGSAVALFLARAGHDVTVYERVEEPGPVGAGIVLQPTGMAVLARLGLADEVVARGAPLSGLDVKKPNGRSVVHLDYVDLAADLYGVGLHRGALFQTLSRALGRTEARVVTGIEATSLELRGAEWFVRREAGDELGPHDLIVVADGSRSRVADSFFAKRRHAAYPWGALWFVAEDREGLFRDRLEQVVERASRLVGLLPTGLGPVDETRPAVPLVSLFYSVRFDRVDALRADFGAFRAELLRLAPRSRSVVEQAESERDFVFTSYRDVTMRPFHERGVVALGDAAHAMSPQLGQGANLALWDAMVLADCLASSATRDDALALYSRLRRGHLDWFQWATRTLTPYFQGDSGFRGFLRDLGMPILAKFPAFRRLMIASMVGDTCGPFRAPVALPHRPPAFALPAHSGKQT